MEEIVNFVDNIKRYFKFNILEIRGILIVILVFAFIISFKEWGVANFDVVRGLTNLFISVFIVAISVLIHLSGQRIWAIGNGYRAEFKMNSIGLFLGVILVFVTNGNFWFLVPGGVIIHHLSGHRYGWFRYGLNYWALGLIALAGPLATLLFLILLKIIGVIFPYALIQKFIIFNVIYNIYSMLPIPPLDGSRIFFGSRWSFAFQFCFIIIATLLLYIDVSPLIAIGGSFLIAIALWVTYYLLIEKDLWSP